ncbi:MAG: hypothetical protein NC548_26455 [Lachnospiraceae bacterium]|nr:hypothetical protein [Lachnospiraceae bacterium]
MAYKIMKNLVQRGNRTREELLDMADVYFAAGRLTKEQYEEIVRQINEKES